MRPDPTQTRLSARAPHRAAASVRRCISRLLPRAQRDRPDTAARAGLEPLEPRLLLSGDLSVAVSGTTLKITGDAQDNQIVIDGSSGDLVLSGQDGELFDGQTGPLTFAQPIQSIVIKLTKGGDNAITVQDATLAKKVTLKSGNGGDTVLLNRLTARDVKLKTKDGADTITIMDSTISGNLKINTKDGIDQILIDPTTIDGKLDINSGRGNDRIEIEASTVASKTKINASAGDDDLDFRSVDPSNPLRLAGNVKINLGSGDDRITVKISNASAVARFDGRVRVNGGGGTDLVDCVADLAIAPLFAHTPTGKKVETVQNCPV